jgi:peptide/nickel transport system substrate-binding protein
MFRRSLLTGLLASSVKIAPALAHPVPKRGGKLVYAAGTDVQTLDPQMIGDIPTARIVMQMYETLVAQGPDGTIGPQLAASWSTSNDELVWTFALRPGVTFQDGTPFEAEAVKATFDRLRDPATRSPRHSALEPVASIDVVDPHTVRLTTKAPYAPLLATLSSYNLAILSPAQIRAKGAPAPRHRPWRSVVPPRPRL